MLHIKNEKLRFAFYIGLMARVAIVVGVVAGCLMPSAAEADIVIESTYPVGWQLRHMGSVPLYKGDTVISVSLEAEEPRNVVAMKRGREIVGRLLANGFHIDYAPLLATPFHLKQFKIVAGHNGVVGTNNDTQEVRLLPGLESVLRFVSSMAEDGTE